MCHHLTINQLLDKILSTEPNLLDPAMYRTVNHLRKLKLCNVQGGLLKVSNTDEILKRLELLHHPEMADTELVVERSRNEVEVSS